MIENEAIKSVHHSSQQYKGNKSWTRAFISDDQ